MLARIAAASIVLLAAPPTALAHCDTLDGPVVKAARTALETGKAGPVLAWVQAGDEAAVRAAFDHARAVRKLGPEARELADRFFLETLVRVHRAGEGAPYTGLKPAGQDLGPAVPAADRAVEKGSAEAVEKLLFDAVRKGLDERFARVGARKVPGDDVAQGRAWVEAYVPYVHWVEGVYEAAAGKANVHPEPAEGPHAHAAQGERAHAH
jgi:Family of unknown function (DUF6448)